MPKVLRTRIVQVVSNPISDDEARGLIVEARINIDGCLDVYESCSTHTGFIQRLFTLEVDKSWDNNNPDVLLAHARANMPDKLTFGA